MGCYCNGWVSVPVSVCFTLIIQNTHTDTQVIIIIVSPDHKLLAAVYHSLAFHGAERDQTAIRYHQWPYVCVYCSFVKRHENNCRKCQTYCIEDTKKKLHTRFQSEHWKSAHTCCQSQCTLKCKFTIINIFDVYVFVCVSCTLWNAIGLLKCPIESNNKTCHRYDTKQSITELTRTLFRFRFSLDRDHFIPKYVESSEWENKIYI